MNHSKLKAALVAVFLCLNSGCSVYVGMSVHPEGADAPEYFAPNPIGIVGGEIECPLKTRCFIEHTSSIPYLESGYGFNQVGVKKYFQLR
jgi:hypothetical protein